MKNKPLEMRERDNRLFIPIVRAQPVYVREDQNGFLGGFLFKTPFMERVKMKAPFCFDCRFFVPEGSFHNELTEDKWDDCLEGQCRAALPVLGRMVKDRHDDLCRDFAEWPKVMASDWCVTFEPVGRDIAS